MATEIALVTGGNRGLGLEVCRQLGAAGASVIGTSRDVAAGEAARADLERAGAQVKMEPLDVASESSIRELGQRLADRHMQLDILVNNAGIAMKGFNADVAERTLRVNFFGALYVTEAMLPLMRPGGRIVMVSSGLGELSSVGDDLRGRLLDPRLDRAGLVALAEEFVRDVREGVHERRGWPSSAYRVSKVALNALTRVLARDLRPRGILVNAVCPGWVHTALGGASAPRSPEEGARSIVWAAKLPKDGPTGGFFRDGLPIPW